MYSEKYSAFEVKINAVQRNKNLKSYKDKKYLKAFVL